MRDCEKLLSKFATETYNFESFMINVWALCLGAGISLRFRDKFFTVGARDTKFCRGIHRGITLTILSAQGGGLGPSLSPLIVLFCALFPGGVRILVKSTWQDRIAWKFFFRLTPNSPCFRQLKRFTAQKGALQHSRVKNNMDLSFIVDDFWLQKVF